MAKPETLATVASIIAGLGAEMLAFRIEREVSGQEEGKQSWIPWADGLLIAAITVALVFVVLPLVIFTSLSGLFEKLPSAACAVTCILLAGYVFAILAHYRLIFGRKRKGERTNPEPAERWIVLSTALISLVVFVGVFSQ